MSVKYVVVGRGKPGVPDSPKKYYSMVKSTGEIDLRELSNQIADVSTVTPIDVLAVLESLLQMVPQHIADGKIVRLGDFGDFRLTLKSEGSESADAVSVHKIKSSHLRFRPGKVFKQTLNNIQCKKAAS